MYAHEASLVSRNLPTVEHYEKKIQNKFVKKANRSDIFSVTDGSTMGEPQQKTPDSSATINLDFPSGRVTIDTERREPSEAFIVTIVWLLMRTCQYYGTEQNGHNEILRIQTMCCTHTRSVGENGVTPGECYSVETVPYFREIPRLYD